MNDKHREIAVFELIVAALCLIVGGMFVGDAFMSYYSYESQVFDEWRLDVWATIVGIAFIVIGGLLIWGSERYRYKKR